MAGIVVECFASDGCEECRYAGSCLLADSPVNPAEPDRVGVGPCHGDGECDQCTEECMVDDWWESEISEADLAQFDLLMGPG